MTNNDADMVLGDPERIKVNIALDTLGLRCPEPIMLVRKTIRELDAGMVLHLVADDPATLRDIPSFCRHMDHQLIASQTNHSPYEFWIKKSD